MKSIVVPKRSRAINDFLDQARDEDITVQTADGTRFVVSAVDDFALEIEAQRRNPKLMALLDELGKQEATIPLEQVRAELSLKPSRSRKKKPAQKNGRKK